MSTYSIYYFLKKTLLFIGLTSTLFFPGMTRLAEVHAQPTLLNSTSININGEAWTFRTPPPPVSQRQVISSHPRLFLTQANLPEIRQKLADAIYADDMNKLNAEADAGSAIANALLYQLNGDISRGTVAKNWLLSATFEKVKGFDTAAQYVEPILVFDWVFPLLTSTERITAFGRLKSNFGYDHQTDPAPREGETLYWNDVWARLPELQYPILALAIAGDGINNDWAQEVLGLAYNESPLVIGPYGETKGAGFLDMLASVSLDDGGGAQAGADGFLGENYYSLFLHSFLAVGAWETATGQPMWSRVPIFRKLPSFWAHERFKTPQGLGSMMPEILTGIYKNIDPDEAALAKWMFNKWGEYKYALAYRLVLGDLRVVPKSPQEIGLPTAKYIRGADLFTSSRSWDDDAVTVTAYSKYLDTNRFEPGSGVFAITRGQVPLAVPADPNKTSISAGTYSGLWIYDPNDPKGTLGQSRTYWSNDRAYDAYTAASNPVYFPGGPDNIVINNTYRAISTEYTYRELLNVSGAGKARQSIVHIMDPNRDFIVVYNYTDVPLNLKRAWSMRLAETPSISGNGYSISGMNTTIVAPANHTFDWVGGSGNEFRSPSPEKIWYGNNRAGITAGYSSNSKFIERSYIERFGIGNLFVVPNGSVPEKLEFLVVMEVGNLTPVPVSRISDREVRFGDWQVSFTSDGNFTVVNTGEFPPDTTPPPPPSNLSLQ